MNWNSPTSHLRDKLSGLLCLLCSGIWLLPASVQAQTQTLDFLSGKSLFERHWISSPASTTASDGLGPLYNATSCDTCHPDGGGAQLNEQSPFSTGLVLHFTDPPTRTALGHQWQPYAVRGLDSESFYPKFETVSHSVAYPDGQQVELSRLRLDSGAENLAGTTVISLRLAPDLHGLGELEAAINAGDAAGGFGWQASAAKLPVQIGLALSRDMGLGNPLYPAPGGDCTEEQAECLQLAQLTRSGESPEISATVLQLLTAYVRGLEPPQVPAIHPHDPGYKTFESLGCAQCHRQQLASGADTVQSAFTDLALHDMGPGLADRTPGDEPVTTRWRTPPLWSLQERLASGNAAFLHDGRARSLEQAILWHDGEAQAAREAFMQLPEAEREALLQWLASL